jgi:nucleotide-binding universal stress UspA family protein
MTWKPIVAGVDASPEGVRAAVAAVELAEAAKTQCYLVHAVRDPWTDVYVTEVPMDMSERNRLVLDAAQTLLLQVLQPKVPAAALDRLEVAFGPSPILLSEAADKHDAELIVLGGKQHSTLGRWLAGSTAHNLIRMHDRPLLVLGPERKDGTESGYRRVLAALDLSAAAGPTIERAERFAELFRSKLRALHVVEPAPLLSGLPVTLDADMMLRAEDELDRSVWPLITYRGAEQLVRRGPVAATIAAAAAEWNADLVVVGTHGRGWVDRVLIGSVAEQLLNRLPASLLVIPVSTPVATLPQARGSARSASGVKPGLTRAGKGKEAVR